MRYSLLAAFLPGLAALGCSASPPEVPPWPEAAEVARMTATVSDVVTTNPSLPEFEVPAEYVPAVLRVLRPPKYCKHPEAKLLQEVGQLRVVCHDGRSLEVRLLFYGKEPVLFTLDGVPCIRGGPYQELTPGSDVYLPEVLTFEGVLRSIQQRDKAKAREYLQLLDKSAGRVGAGEQVAAKSKRGHRELFKPNQWAETDRGRMTAFRGLKVYWSGPDPKGKRDGKES